MQGFNHLAGGFLVCGLAGSFSDFEFLTPQNITVCLVASMIPDVDTHYTTIGRLTKPLSTIIYEKYGHRTATHSLIFLLLSSLIFYLFSAEIAFFWFFGLLSHVVFDMTTIAGVQFFYPNLTRCVLPANPTLRIRTGDLKAESIIFFVFLSSNIFLYDYYKKGFFSTYNQYFATAKHVQREAKETKKLLYVKKYGYLIAENLCFENGVFSELPKDEKFEFEGTEKKIIVARIDTLLEFGEAQNFLSENSFLELSIYSKKNILFVGEKTQKLSLKNVSSVQIEQETPEELAALELELQQLKSDARAIEQAEQKKRSEIEDLKSKFSSLTDYEKTKSLERLKVLEGSTPEQKDQSKIIALQQKINSLKTPQKIKIVCQTLKIK